MKPTPNFANGSVTIELSPFQCADIAAACRFASEYSFAEQVEAWRTLAALFHACTIAGFAHWHISGPDLTAVHHQLDLLNLSRNDDDDKSKLNSIVSFSRSQTEFGNEKNEKSGV